MGRGPYYNLKEAAAYCGYRSTTRFRELVQEYHVPAKGPNNNRYAEADLDLFMEHPEAFLQFHPTPGKKKQLQL